MRVQIPPLLSLKLMMNQKIIIIHGFFVKRIVKTRSGSYSYFATTGFRNIYFNIEELLERIKA